MRNGIKRMIADIEREVVYTSNMIGKSQLDPRVMDAMRDVPRDEFVPDEMKMMAFNNGALPIGNGQTISQPYIVALMTDMLQLEPDNVVLEIGTGSGYQSAVLSKLCKQVYTMEVVATLSEEATRRLEKMNYNNIETRVGNGYDGWPEHAPYDGIMVTAAATHIPETLIEQLKPGGRLVIPVGLPYMHQELMLVTKGEQGKTHVNNVLGVIFVPMVHEE